MSRIHCLVETFADQLSTLERDLINDASSALEERRYADLESLASDLRLAGELLNLLRPYCDIQPEIEVSPASEPVEQAVAVVEVLEEPVLETSEDLSADNDAKIEEEAPAEAVAVAEQDSTAEPDEPLPNDVAAEDVERQPVDAQPIPKHLVPPQGSELEQLRQQFFEAARELQDSETIDKTNRCLFKSIICLGWFLHGVERDKPTKDAIKEEISRLSCGWKTKTDEYFFGLSSAVTSKPEYWYAFSRSFRFLQFGIVAVDLLANETGIKNKRDLLEMVAYCETSLYRLITDIGINYYDNDQRDLHQHLENTGLPPFQCWKAHAEGGPKTETVFEHAAALEQNILEIANRKMKAEKRNEKLSAIKKHIAQPQNFHDFNETLRELVLNCLEANIPPSDKALRGLLAPYRAELTVIEHSQAHQLVQYLERDANKTIAKKLQPVDIDIPEDEEHQLRLEAVKGFLKDKSMLIIGGNKGQTRKIEELRKGLGLKSLEWPPTEEHTKNSHLEEYVNRADAVCLAVRWARHSRKDLLDYAKRQGKSTAVLPRGTGLNTIVYDLYGQWCNGNSAKNGNGELVHSAIE